MAWRKIEKAPSWDFEANPVLQGVLVSKEAGVGQNDSNLYRFETKDGENVSLWGSVVLDDRLAQVDLGTELKISYKGKVKNEQSGRSFKSYEVEIND